jgi:hypothetical protein
MSDAGRPMLDEVEQLMLNAQLRDELEPYVDESLSGLAQRRMPLSVENEYLASMLAWERAPAMPISQWFSPELVLPNPDAVSPLQLHSLLWDTIQRLYDQRVVLECTDHLDDSQLYRIIYRDILPAWEKKVDLPRNFLHWRCLDDDDVSTWLRYYATKRERLQFREETGIEPPAAEPAPFPRQMPSRLL